MTAIPPRGWNQTLRDQLDFHYRQLFRPRVEGLTDEEYLWEPVPPPAPVTTIAWRIAHLTVECLSMRTINHFGGATAHGETSEYTDSADQALAQLDAAYDAWSAGVTGLGEEGLIHPVGPDEGPWADSPYADLVLHINRELIHHGAEICLLRDLYLRRKDLR